MVRLLVSAVIPGFYFFTSGAPLKGALFLSAVILSGNLSLLLFLLPPFAGQTALFVAAVISTTYFWAFNLLTAAFIHSRKIREKEGSEGVKLDKGE
ncbi:MAG: hypothetical protein N2234_09810 [Planctomycetota bacterium]|nr:hypothetical protein [Planctomycetota bacterium]